MDRRNCEECGQPLVGRSDKKFCDAYCRNAYNNKHKRDHEVYIHAVNKILRKNRSILKHLSPMGKTIARKEVMDSHGFDFNCFTSMYRTQGGNIYYMCYDFGFQPIIETDHGRVIEKAIIINRQTYMGDWKPWKYVNRMTSE